MAELTMYNANALKVKLEDGTQAYFEVQEHCDLFSPEGCDGYVAGHYHFESVGLNKVIFKFTDKDYIAKVDKIGVLGEVVAYSHDYGKTWVEVE